MNTIYPVKKRFLLLFFIGILFSNTNQYLFAQIPDTLKAKDLIYLSFEELMNVKIDIGTLTGIEQSKLPLSLTTITEEDIRHTPARNIINNI